MKKIYLILFALLMSIVTFAALNPYAYALSSSLSADETTLTVNYSLNADATEVNVVILNGETAVKTIPCTGITKGAYTIEIPTTDFPKSTNLTWKVEVKGNSVTKPTQETTMYNMYCPHGLAIDKDPNSDYFGRILVAEAMHAVKGITNSAKEEYVATVGGAGLYVFRPDFTTDSLVHNGGLNFTRVLSSGYQPWRVKISEDGRIFVSSLDKNGVAVWEVSKDLQTWTPVISGTNKSNTDYNIYDEEGNFIAGLNCSMDVKGSGEDLKLLLYSSKDLATAQSSFRLDEYALGTATVFTGTPRNIFNYGDKKYGLVHNYVDFIYDGEGGYWFGASRSGTAGQPNLVHINAEGVQDYYTEDASYYGGAGVFVHNGMLFKGKARTSASVGNFDVYTIGKDAEGKVTLTKKWAVVANGIGRQMNQFAVDYAENLYVVGNANEKIIAYAMPYDGEVATPAASKYAFQLQGVQGTFYDLIVNCDETKGKVTGNNGQYLEGTTATLTATANRGYKFSSWTVGEETVTENPLTITVNANTTVTANFEALAAYTITATANDATMGTIQGAGTYYAGETVTLKAVANDGHHFVNWSNDATAETITFEAAENLTLTANFAKNIYTLTVNVNDTKKGSVDKATATYEFGTAVTLTATPTVGCELLAWSDRSTAQTLTITMDGNKAVTAYFVTSYVNEPELKVEKVWENANVPAATANGYQAVGWDGVIYMQDKGNEKIKAISAEATTEYAASGAGQQIAVDQAGNLVVFNAYFATATPNSILIYKKGETEGKAVAFTLKDPAACHFFSASGDIFSAEGGYIYFYCNGKTAINRLKITNGAATEADVTTDLLGSIYQGGTQNHVMVDIWGNLVAHARSNAVNYINSITGESKAFTLPSIKMGTLGGCSFELAGKELWAYHAGATNYSSEWNIYNMTDAKFVSDEDFYIVDKAATTNYAANWLNVQVIDEKTAYIYQFCPLKGAAMWKVTANFVKPATPTIEVSENSVVTITSATPNAVIYYDWTIDATVALGEETKYAEPIALDLSVAKTYQIEALAVLDGEKSDIVTATFEIKGNGEAVNLESVNALAVVYSTAGNLNIQTQVGTTIEVYNLHGQRLFAAEATAELTTIPLNEQIVVVRVADQVLKVNIK